MVTATRPGPSDRVLRSTARRAEVVRDLFSMASTGLEGALNRIFEEDLMSQHEEQ